MKYGAMNFPVLPVIDEISRIAELGFDYLELAMDPPCAHYSTLRNKNEMIRAELEKQGLFLICHLPTFVSIADLTESIRRASLAEMLNSLRTAEELGAVKVVFHPGSVRGMAQFVPDRAADYGLRSLAALHDLAVALEIPLCIENMFPAYGAFFETDAYDAVFDRYPDMRMTLDTGHAHIGAPDGNRLRRFVKRFGPRIDHVHISDNAGTADEHLPPGAGSIDFPGLVRRLKTIRFDATVTFEIFTDTPGDLEASRIRFENWWHR